MIILGIILLVIGFIAKVAILWSIGIILLLVGLVLVGATITEVISAGAPKPLRADLRQDPSPVRLGSLTYALPMLLACLARAAPHAPDLKEANLCLRRPKRGPRRASA
jgi:hypothetical protein